MFRRFFVGLQKNTKALGWFSLVLAFGAVMRFVLCVLSFLFINSVAYADDIKIGVAGPMTGGLAAFGEQIQHGAQLAVDEINQQGGLLGKRLSLSVVDDACDPKQAHDVASKLVTEKVAIVFGHWCSAAAMAASSVYGEEGVLQIDTGSLLKNYTHQNFPTIFRVSSNTVLFAKAIGTYTLQHNPKANVAILTDQPAVTNELADELQKFFTTTENKVVAVEQIRSGDKDFSSIIDHLKVLKAQVVICSCYTIEAGLIARQLIDKQLDVFYYSWDTINSPDFLSIIANTKTEKIVSVDYARPPASADLERITAELHRRNWPVETTTFMTYAAFQVFANAVKTANSFDALKVTKALHSGETDTILGPIAFDSFGDRIKPAFASYQWINGKLTMIGTIAN